MIRSCYARLVKGSRHRAKPLRGKIPGDMMTFAPIVFSSLNEDIKTIGFIEEHLQSASIYIAQQQESLTKREVSEDKKQENNDMENGFLIAVIIYCLGNNRREQGNGI
jgi:hypothetical protein